MPVDYRLQRRWREARGMLACDTDDVLRLLQSYGQRAGETDEEFRARLQRENDAFAAEMDRLEDLDSQTAE